MAEAMTLRMGRLAQPRSSRPRDRLHAFLEARYSGRPSDLATELNCSKKSAENLLDGHWPADDLKLAAIFSRFGRDLYDAVFAPDVDAVLARLQEEERQLAEQLAEIRRRRRQTEGLREGGPGDRSEFVAVVAGVDRKKAARRK